MSRDKPAAQKKWADKYDLPFPLLSDPEHAIHEKYGAWGEKNMYGKKVMGVLRTTVVIGPDGKIVKIYKKVKAAGHAAQVLADL
ncbi:Thiol peroxidase, Bcp-type [hydrothermal vent metagenome]|uniref:Thiol peroxidase, Bcp-type n=1 Tax=hydrothermal vent metagenome TaxID=652676 RepID=A0A3B1BN22_9ZZZZ